MTPCSIVRQLTSLKTHGVPSFTPHHLGVGGAERRTGLQTGGRGGSHRFTRLPTWYAHASVFLGPIGDDQCSGEGGAHLMDGSLTAAVVVARAGVDRVQDDDVAFSELLDQTVH